MVPPKKLEDRLDRFRQGCREAGLKVTHQRLEIFREVATSVEHPDAETVFQAVRRKLPTVSLDTVYRTLWTMIDLGLLTSLGPDQRRVRFDANLDAHHHFICSRCGKTVDFFHPAFDQLRPPPAVARVGHVERLQVECRGICKACAKKPSSSSRKGQ